MENNIEQHQQDLINILDEDCLSIIFSYLPAIQTLDTAQVCKKWNNATLLTWKSIKKIDCIYDENLSKEENLLLNENKIKIILLRLGLQLTHLKLIKTCQANMLPVIIKNCQKLIDIIFDFDDVDDHNIQNNLSILTNLKSVVLKYTLKPMSTLNHNFIIQFLNIISDGINKLSISSKYDPCFESIEFLKQIKKFNALSHLTLNNCQLDGNVVKEISLKESLIHLDLKNSTVINGQLIANLVNLKHLNIAHVADITDNEFKTILNKCKTIIHLNIEGCQNISEQSLKNLELLKNLEYLNISCIEKITGNFMVFLSLNCKNIKHLNLFNCLKIDKYNFEEIGKMKNLEYLSITISKNDIDDNSIISIAENCHNLTYLSIKSIINKLSVHQSVFNKLGQLINLQELHIVNILNARNSLFDNMLNLRVISITNCPRINDSGIIKIIEKCHKLESLILYNSNLTSVIINRAVKITHKRKNIVLKIKIDSLLYEQFKMSHFYNKYKNDDYEFISPYLIIECE